MQLDYEIWNLWKHSHSTQPERGILFKARIDLLGAKSDVMFTHMEYNYDPWEKGKGSNEANLHNKLLPWQPQIVGDILENKKELLCIFVAERHTRAYAKVS